MHPDAIATNGEEVGRGADVDRGLFRDLPVRGAPVVLALNAGVVFVTGSDDVAGLVALPELGRQVFELPKPMTPVPRAGDRPRARSARATLRAPRPDGQVRRLELRTLVE